jgi:hypothetical protein
MNEETDYGVGLLERLLAATERSPDRTRPAAAAPDYGLLRTAEALARFHAMMAAAERVGAIEVAWGRRERAHLIERIRVRDGAKLAKHLGRDPAVEVAEKAKGELAAVAATGAPWVGEIVEDMAVKWGRGDAAHRLVPKPIGPALEFVRLLVAISRDEARGLDARTFSLKAIGDSKAFDRHTARIATVIAARMGIPGAPGDRVWSHIGLERFSHPIHLKGCVVVEDETGVLVDGRGEPFASIHAEMLPKLRIVDRPRAVLTIENYASFNRHVREISDGALVVYVGGFPSAAVTDLLKRLSKEIDGSPFLHWGDVDAGGFRIFRYVEEIIARPLRPHLMTQELARRYGRPCEADDTLAPIAKSESAIAELARWLAYGPDPRTLEQEALDPAAISIDELEPTITATAQG